jgi:hypothetical protein
MTTIHEGLTAAARGMEERAKALHRVAAELAGMAETPPKTVAAEVLARELIKIDLCLLHKGSVKLVVDYLTEIEKSDDGYSFDRLDTEMPGALRHMKSALYGHDIGDAKP